MAATPETGGFYTGLPRPPAGMPPEVEQWANQLVVALERLFLVRRGGIVPVTATGRALLALQGNGDIDQNLFVMRQLTTKPPAQDT